MSPAKVSRSDVVQQVMVGNEGKRAVMGRLAGWRGNRTSQTVSDLGKKGRLTDNKVDLHPLIVGWSSLP